jgi:nucleotide-binding universal stress UspA family protein
MTTRWTVGVDGSDAAVVGLRWATWHAATREAEVTVLSAYHVPAIMSLFAAKRGFGVDELGLAATAGHDADVAVAAVAGTAPQDVPVTTTVVEGQPGPALVDASRQSDLLVVGKQGGGSGLQQRLGSVSRYCATHALCPVAAVPADWTPHGTEHIVVGFDGSEHAVAAFEWALAFADESAQVEVVAAMEVAPWLGGRLTRERFPDEVAEQERTLLSAMDGVDPTGRARRTLVLDAPRTVLADASRAADLVVVGARGRGVMAAELLGSVSMWLLQDVDAPIVVVPAGPAG